jgi:superfamily II DNA or RNA helicase
MTRKELREQVLKEKCPNILLELATGFGKSKLALEILHNRVSNIENPKILIVIPKLVLINNWKKEFVKWRRFFKYLKNVTFTTYISLPKKVGKWDVIIYDECHHLSERCLSYFKYIQAQNIIFLSATVSRDKLYQLQLNTNYHLKVFKVTAKEAIKEEILPDPKVYLLRLVLDRKNISRQIIKNPEAKTQKTIPYASRFSYARVKNLRIVIPCTQGQFYDELDSLVRWFKSKINASPAMKMMYLRKAGERLKWLSNEKTDIIKSLLHSLGNYRTLTFCNSIEQSELLGKYCIHSKNKEGIEYLNKFNNGKINHITCVSQLDEGINLHNCQIGIYGILNSSTRLVQQRLGRLLRHPNPIIIIPYFTNTRDEELVKKMLEDYNPEKVTTIRNINELKDIINGKV